MFALFFSLYLAMFRGSWSNLNLNQMKTFIETPLDAIGKLATTIFGDTNYETFGQDITSMIHLGGETYIPAYLGLVSFILALITCIGIVVMAVKGIKKVFGIFFMGIRR